jgi:diguanylate cyclase (GGDEF)-like protein
MPGVPYARPLEPAAGMRFPPMIPMSPLEVLAQHDPILVTVAVVVCLTGSLAAVSLLRHAFNARGGAKGGWLFLCAVTTGAAIWATHFISLLAFNPFADASYDAGLTSLSFFVAVAGCGIGVWMTAWRPAQSAAAIGGFVIGIAITTMHFAGMAATGLTQTVESRTALTATGVALGIALSVAAMMVARRYSFSRARYFSALLVTLAICIMHFTAMSAVMVGAEHAVDQSSNLMASRHVLGLIVGGVALLLAGSAYATSTITRESEADTAIRLKHLADAAIEGLVLTDGERMLDVNESFLKIVGLDDADELRGHRFWGLVRNINKLPDDRYEGEMLRGRTRIPVEIIARTSVTGTASRCIFAVRDLTERREAEESIRFLAFHDSLTGLPNRAAFNDRISGDMTAASHRMENVALLLFDLDRFKEINDIYGHAVGDAVLKRVADSVKPLLSSRDFLARLGGDEFAIIQSTSGQPERAAALAEQIQALFPTDAQQVGRDPKVSLSIGVSIFPGDGGTPEKLLANADLALYRAKARGRACVCFFEPHMDEVIRSRRLLGAQLKSAIEEDALEVFYQPQVRVSDGTTLAYEALVRWRHPERGYIAPDEFVGVAEESDLIYELGDWVLKRACREAAAWAQPFRVAVNISPAQFNQADLVTIIHETLIASGLPPRRLELEITETALIEDRQRALNVLRRIKALGISVALDDFGTGYSSLSTLQAFPFDKLKIDKSFIAAIHDDMPDSFVRAILGLGRSLDIPVLAEGVETDRQLAFLVEERCDEAQGYLFGMPMPERQLPHLRDAGAPAPGGPARKSHAA